MNNKLEIKNLLDRFARLRGLDKIEISIIGREFRRLGLNFKLYGNGFYYLSWGKMIKISFNLDSSRVELTIYLRNCRLIIDDFSHIVNILNAIILEGVQNIRRHRI